MKNKKSKKKKTEGLLCTCRTNGYYAIDYDLLMMMSVAEGKAWLLYDY
jgi:hypothetical protein